LKSSLFIVVYEIAFEYRHSLFDYS
jgi:hypothetical protein